MSAALRNGFAIAGVLTAAVFAVGGSSTTAFAGSSYKIVTAPGSEKLAQAKPSNVPHADEPLFDEQPAGASDNLRIVKNEQATTGADQAIVLAPGTIREITFEDAIGTVVPADTKVVTVLPLDDHKFILTAQGEGSSDVVVFNPKNGLVKMLAVTVDKYVESTSSLIRDPDAKIFATVEIHNKALVNSQTNFRCGPSGCAYIGEVAVQEPAPLPKGYSSITSNNTNTNTNNNVTK